jgi:hypothetical protein
MTLSARHSASVRVIVLGLATAFAGCQGSGTATLTSQIHTPEGAVERLEVVQSDDDSATAVIGSSTVPQVVAAPQSSELRGTEITFPPGAVPAGSVISVAAGQLIVSDSVASEIGYEGVTLDKASAALVVDTPGLAQAAAPFTVALALADGAALTDGDAADLVVVYRVRDPAGGGYVVGTIVGSSLTFVDGKATFETTLFGVYQLARPSQPITEAKSSVSTVGFATKAEAKTAPEITLKVSTSYLAAKLALNVDFQASGAFMPATCTVFMDADRDRPWDRLLTFTTPPPYAVALGSGPAATTALRVECSSASGALAKSEWSAVAIPERTPAPVATPRPTPTATPAATIPAPRGNQGGGSLAVNGGAPATNSRSVTLGIGSAGAPSIYLSNAGCGVDGAWEPAVAGKSWTLSAGDGQKTVYMLLGEAPGSQRSAMRAASVQPPPPPPCTYATIVLDTVAPSNLASFARASAQQVGTIGLAWTWPSATTDFGRLEIRMQTGSTPPTCHGGTVVETIASLATTSVAIHVFDTQMPYSFRACVVDLAGNGSTGSTLSSQQASNSLRAFVSQATFPGDIGGLIGADGQCNAAAANAGLGAGSYWRAMLSDNYTSIRSRLIINGPVKLLNGTVIANDDFDLFDGDLAAPIDRDETGTVVGSTYAVWTGTDSMGHAFVQGACANWRYAGGSKNGMYGRTTMPDYHWLAEAATACTSPMRIYCIEQAAPHLPQPYAEPGASPGQATVTVYVPATADAYYSTLQVVAGTGVLPPPEDCSLAGDAQQIGGMAGHFSNAAYSYSGIGTVWFRVCVKGADGRVIDSRVARTVTKDDAAIFVTSTSHDGGFGGWAAGDAICTARATEAGFTGVAWHAALTDPNHYFIDTANTITGPVYDLANTLISSNLSGSLTATSPPALVAPIGYLDNGDSALTAAYWSGTGNFGGPANADCSEWTSTASAVNGSVGSNNPSPIGPGWINMGSVGCNNLANLLCVGETVP